MPSRVPPFQVNVLEMVKVAGPLMKPLSCSKLAGAVSLTLKVRIPPATKNRPGPVSELPAFISNSCGLFVNVISAPVLEKKVPAPVPPPTNRFPVLAWLLEFACRVVPPFKVNILMNEFFPASATVNVPFVIARVALQRMLLIVFEVADVIVMPRTLMTASSLARPGHCPDPASWPPC